jgi:hypothetical protein
MRLVIPIDPDRATIVEGEQINRTRANNLICDMTIPALGVLDLPDLHYGQPTSSHRQTAAGVS